MNSSSMAVFHNYPSPTLFFPFIFLLIFPFCPPSFSMLSIHDLLKSKGLPAGLFPKEVVNNYTLSPMGLLHVYLNQPCLTKLDTMAFYETVVTANLTRGCLTGVEGFSQEELFVWLPVKDVIVGDPSSGIILFDIGLAHKQLSLSLFEDPPDCKNDGPLKMKTHKEKGFEGQR